MKRFTAAAITVIALCTVFTAIASAQTYYNPKLTKINGTWFLRSQATCTEMKFNRKGRSDWSLIDREAYMDRRPDALYLTIKKYGWIQTYRMNPLVEQGTDFSLELIAVGPKQPPKEKTPLEDRFNGIFRSMVDCQLGPDYVDAQGTVQEQAL